MRDDIIVLVLAVSEPGLRSTLSARLSLAGADVITAKNVHDPALRSGLHGRAVLILDEDMVDGRSDEWLDTLLDEPCWHCLVVLTATPPPETAEPNPRLLYLQLAGAPAAIAALVPQWAAQA